MKMIKKIECKFVKTNNYCQNDDRSLQPVFSYFFKDNFFYYTLHIFLTLYLKMNELHIV